MEVERLQRDYPVTIKWSPFLLDPSIPPEGRTREPYTKPGDPPTHLEVRGERNGIEFRRGRTYTPNSHLSLETAAFAEDAGIDPMPLHRALFKAHFTDMENLGDIDTLVRIGSEVGLDPAALREALESGQYRQQIDNQLAWAHSLGVSAVPTFVFNDRYAIVGAEEYPAFQRVMEYLGYPPPPGAPPIEGPRIYFEGDDRSAPTGDDD